MRRSLALVLVCGCSFAFVRGPKPTATTRDDCTTSRIAPIADTVFTVLMALIAIGAATADDKTWHNDFCDEFDASCSAPFGQATGAAIFGAAAVAGGAGMYWGYTKTGECRDKVAAPLPPPITDQPQNSGSGSGSGSAKELPLPPEGLPLPGQ
ncbi:MAG TPA: hypothetical protein VGC41_08665 [Kofleriaceae bacterium]